LKRTAAAPSSHHPAQHVVAVAVVVVVVVVAAAAAVAMSLPFKHHGLKGEIVITVKVKVAWGRVAEFLRVMREDALESRKEPGCVCFHVSALEGEREFMFYEVYKNEAAVTKHKETPHYAKWDAFRKSRDKEGTVAIEREEKVIATGVYIDAVPVLGPLVGRPCNGPLDAPGLMKKK